MYPSLMLALLDVYMRNPPVLLCSISMPTNCKLDDWALASHPQTANNLVGKFILKYLSQLLPPSTNPHCTEQWGMQGAGNNWDVYYPITVATILALVAIDAGATASDELQAIGVNPSVTSFKTYSSSGNDFKLSWVAICKS